MFDKDKLLRDIALEGAASDENKTVRVIIANQNHARENLVTFSSGLPKIRNVSGFNLVLRNPLYGTNPMLIKCCLCNKVVNYPAWHKSLKYVVNQFHYFICFDPSSPRKPTGRCYKI